MLDLCDHGDWTINLIKLFSQCTFIATSVYSCRPMRWTEWFWDPNRHNASTIFVLYSAWPNSAQFYCVTQSCPSFTAATKWLQLLSSSLLGLNPPYTALTGHPRWLNLLQRSLPLLKQACTTFKGRPQVRKLIPWCFLRLKSHFTAFTGAPRWLNVL